MLGGIVVYFFLVLMNVILVKVAGVKRIVMVLLVFKGEINLLVLVVAKIAGIYEIYWIGGVQVVVVLVYGIEIICAVDKIVGLGNVYVVVVKC